MESAANALRMMGEESALFVKLLDAGRYAQRAGRDRGRAVGAFGTVTRPWRGFSPKTPKSLSFLAFSLQFLRKSAKKNVF